MDKKKFLLLMDELFELNSGTLKGDESLEKLSNWNSLAVIGFIAMIHEHYHINIRGTNVNSAKTLFDLYNLVQSEVEKSK